MIREGRVEAALTTMDPLRSYRETQIKTAAQGKLILMLYDGAIKHLNLALEHLESNHRKFDEVFCQVAVPHPRESTSEHRDSAIRRPELAPPFGVQALEPSTEPSVPRRRPQD